MVTRYRPREVDYGFDDDVRRPAIGTQAQTAGQETERSSPSRLGGNVGMDGRERCLSDEDPMAVFRGRMIDHWGPENRRREGQRPVDILRAASGEAVAGSGTEYDDRPLPLA